MGLVWGPRVDGAVSERESGREVEEKRVDVGAELSARVDGCPAACDAWDAVRLTVGLFDSGDRTRLGRDHGDRPVSSSSRRGQFSVIEAVSTI